MGVRILVGREAGSSIDAACLFCSTTGLAFGPVIDDHTYDGCSGQDVLESFLESLTTGGRDARQIPGVELATLIDVHGEELARRRASEYEAYVDKVVDRHLASVASVTVLAPEGDPEPAA